MAANKMQNWKLLLFGLGVHLVLFYSIFDIYFKSPLVHGMSPHSSTAVAPAKRIVLFVADGLRADKFFELTKTGETRAPYLRNIIKNVGAWGVSHTHVPTESRPGHVALIAGFYEDVSAVAKGWKENPVEFDSVFNESRHTWSWGSPDILPMFAKGVTCQHIHTYMYAPEKVDFGSTDSSRLDFWVFKKVEEFFDVAHQNQTLFSQLNKDKLVFFLHLLGIDTNGHSHRPHSKEYLQNIRIVDEGIRKTEKLIEKFYQNDKLTSYVFTADHGMTNWGSHGAGDPHETLTPLVAWGAGIRGPKRTMAESSTSSDGLSEEWHLNHLQRTDVEQADIAPLMASLIGIPFPMNSVGNLPIDYLSSDLASKAEHLFTNAKQMLAQYTVKMEEIQNTSLSMAFRPFKELTPAKQAFMMRHIMRLLHAGQFEDAITESQRAIVLTLKGLQYYQTYDRFFLGASVVFSFIGWIGFVSSLLLQEYSGLVSTKSKMEMVSLLWWQKNSVIKTCFAFLGGVTIVLLFVTSSPLMYYIYCLLTLSLWMHIALKKDIFLTSIRFASSSGQFAPILLRILAIIVGLEILIYGFFLRQMISLGLLLMAFWAPICFCWKSHKFTILGWIFSCLAVAIFPLLPVVNRDTNYNFVYISGAITVILGLIAIYRTSSDKNIFATRKVEIIQLLLVVLSVYVVWSTTNSLALRNGLPQINQYISWSLLGSCFILPLFSHLRAVERLLSLNLAFIGTFLLMSIFYECFFLLSLCCLLWFWLQLECIATSSVSLSTVKLENLSFSSSSLPEKGQSNLSKEDIRRAFFFVFLIFTAFFGTGNIASINSFDPASVYCFLTVFNPFIMGGLLLFKVGLPFLLVTCAFTTLHLITKAPKRILFLIVLIMSDFMGMQFFFHVRDFGSWLEIGSSISHYVIVMSMIIFLLLLEVVGHWLTSICFTGF